MGQILEVIRRFAIGAALALGLSACGSDKGPPALPIKAILTAQIEMLKGGGDAPAAAVAAPDPAVLAEGRRVLQEAGQPVISVTDRSLGLAAFMVPLGQNADVVTWASPEYQTLGMRDGVILATRGFGADLMSAVVPSAAALRAGVGAHQRVHYVLDGADQTREQRFGCQLSVSNGETIAILGLSYLTKKVDEVCTGAAGSFTNSYWFDDAGLIRQSRQVRAVGVENLQLQAIID